MRYDDEKRPKSIGADSSPLQVNGSPLPCVTLIRPMEGEVPAVYRCCKLDIAQGMMSEAAKALCTDSPGSDCPACVRYASETVWGWLCCIHAHIEGSRFGYHTAWVRSVDELLAAWLEDPEAALLRYFKYTGPEPKRAVRPLSPAVGDLFEDQEDEK